MNHSALFRMKRSVKIGTYSFVAGVILMAALIVANLLVGALPAKLTRFDTSGHGITEISPETKKMVAGMTEDVTIYWLCEGGEVDDQVRLLLSRYEEAGKHVKVEVVDPLKDPTFTSKYSDTTLSAYSFIVESDRRYTVVDSADLYYWYNAALSAAYQLYPDYLPADITQPMSYAALSSVCSQYGSMVSYMLSMQGFSISDITELNTVHSFCGEAKITAALDYVTQEYIPHAYLLTGMGDAKPSESLGELLDSMGMNVELLDLSKNPVPVDANCLVLFDPDRDLTAHEASVITDYLNGGGSLMLNTSPEVVASCPNLQSVVALFGLSAEQGLVQEGDTTFISGNQYTLVPTVSTQHTATAYVTSGGFKPQLPNCHAITVASTLPAGVTVTPLFTTSDKAVRVSLDKATTLTEAGKLQVAVAASKSLTTTNGTTQYANLTWYATADSFTDTVAEANSGGNYYFYAATMSIMSESFISVYENLTPVPLQTGYLEESSAALVLVLIVGVVLVPVALLTTGVVIWIRRKRR